MDKYKFDPKSGMILSMIFLVTLMSCTSKTVPDIGQVAGQYVVLDHCEKNQRQYIFDRNIFKIDRIAESDTFRIYPPTPVASLGPDVATWTGMKAIYKFVDGEAFLIIQDRSTGFWSGKYQLFFEANGDIAYLHIENGQRMLLLEDANPLIHVQHVCRGCEYESIWCSNG